MPIFGRVRFTRCLAVLGFSLSAEAASGPFEGYWRRVTDGDYDGYLKVVADSGYRCIMDGKSSYRFKVKGDSITTPMNGMSAIVLTSPGFLRITGREKGVVFHSDYARMDASVYPMACVEEEAEWYGPTAIRPRAVATDRPAYRSPAARSPAYGRRGTFLDALGRIRQAP